MRAIQRMGRQYGLLLVLLSLAALPVFAGPASPIALGAQPRQAVPVPMTDPRWGIERCPYNVTIFRFINGHHTPVADRIAYDADTLGIHSKKIDLGIGWVMLPVFLYTWFYRRRLFLTLVIGIVVETVLVHVVKHTFDQSRPAVLLDHVHQLIHLHAGSFPSGHTAMGFVVAGVLMYRERWWGQCLWLLFAVAIAYQRMYAGVHFPLDVAAGVLIAVVSVALAFAITKKRIDRAPVAYKELGVS